MEAARKTAPRVASRPQHKAAPPAPPKEAPLPKEDDELPETVKRAMMVFGGSLVKMIRINRRNEQCLKAEWE